jgi:uncharacterized protein YegP (UPF0339 family)
MAGKFEWFTGQAAIPLQLKSGNGQIIATSEATTARTPA